MSEPAAKQRQMIDLDEFERRLSRSPAPARGDDPLAELARLVGGVEDRFENMFKARPGRAPAPVPPALPPEPHVPDWLVDESHQHAQPAPPRRVDFSAIEAGLRGSLPPEFQNFQHFEEPHRSYDEADHSYEEQPHLYDEAVDEDDRWLHTPIPPPPEPMDDEAPRSRMALYATAAIILAGMAGIGGTFALKRTPASPQQIALITAPAAPVKVAAPSETDSSASGGASILDKTAQPTPTAVVSHSEQPVDVNAVAQPAAASPPPATQTASTAPADTVPVPPPPAAESGQGADLADMMQPHKVKTIAVRPDGSLADSSAPPPAPPPSQVGSIVPPSMTADYNGGAGAPATTAPPPAADASPPRTASASDDLPWSSQAGQPATPAPEAPAPKRHAQAPEQLASAETGDTDVAETPAHGGSGFSVQLAAPATQVEARAALNRLVRAYGAELRGYHLRFHQAKVANKTVFRVRVGALSHDAAISLCEKLKAKGGACFVARD
jgi:hypothetical protein